MLSATISKACKCDLRWRGSAAINMAEMFTDDDDFLLQVCYPHFTLSSHSAHYIEWFVCPTQNALMDFVNNLTLLICAYLYVQY